MIVEKKKGGKKGGKGGGLCKIILAGLLITSATGCAIPVRNVPSEDDISKLGQELQKQGQIIDQNAAVLNAVFEVLKEKGIIKVPAAK